jgi:steroid 5-alpha reductase family enzyme
MLLTTLAVTLAWMTALWLESLRRRDASIVDPFWGPGFVIVTAVAAVASPGALPRRALVLVLVVIWGLRLGAYLLWRSHGAGEDFRYQAMRRRWGTRFGLVSLATVFWLQALLMWVVSLPVQIAVSAPRPDGLGWLDLGGVALWTAGIGFEAGADWQLARFKADPRHAGEVMDRGLWRYTRHPNYFGDFLVWWGFYAIALATPGGAWTIVGPIVMSVLLMRVSGVPLLERSLRRRRPGYAAYAARTSAFFPWPPRSPEPRT